MKSKKNKLKINIQIGGVNSKQLEILTKLLAMTLSSGLSITEALSLAEKTSVGKLKGIMSDVSKAVVSGRTLSEALAQHKVFSQLYVNTVRVGETAGSLPESLEIMAKHIHKERALISSIREAVAYPIVITIAAFTLALTMSAFVLPKITPLLSQLKVDLPFTTKALIWFSDFFRDNTIVILGAVALVVVVVSWFTKQKFSKPVTSWLTLHLPVVGTMAHEVNLTRFCRTLGNLLKSGIEIVEALEITRNTLENYYYKKAIGKATKGVSAGKQLSEGLSEHSKLFPVVVIQMVSGAERSGKLNETLLYLADYYEEQVTSTAKSLPVFIEPILLALIGIGVAFLALGIITPIFKLTGSIHK